jgi:ADP-ribosylglycohydrolase
MLGAIAGDIIGSPYERHNTRRTDFPLFVPESTFTDDSVLTVATMEVLLTGGDYAEAYRRYFAAYPGRGYGPGFARWAATPGRGPYWSRGNGSAMRVSPVGWCHADLDRVLAQALRSAEVTHNHPDGLMGAQAIAGAVFLACTGSSREDIRRFVETRVGYPLWQTIADLQRHYAGGGTCADTVPPAITAFLESSGWEEAVRLAISIGGDSDTIACMAGAVAEAYYAGVPAEVTEEVRRRLPRSLLAVVDRFAATVSVGQACSSWPA